MTGPMNSFGLAVGRGSVIPAAAVPRPCRRWGRQHRWRRLNRSFCIPTVTVHCTVTRETRKKPSRREKYWVSDAGTGVAHPLNDRF